MTNLNIQEQTPEFTEALTAYFNKYQDNLPAKYEQVKFELMNVSIFLAHN